MEKAHVPKDLDLSGAARGVWLVKVPKYLSEKWQQAGSNSEVGKLRISKPRVPGGKSEVMFSSSEQMQKSGDCPPGGATAGTSSEQKLPRDHKFVLTRLASQSLAVMSREPVVDPAAGDSPNEKVAVEGKVIQRAECRPIGDANYMSLKRTQLEISNKPKREVVQLSTTVKSYKPRTTTVFDKEAELRRKQQTKNVRGDKNTVQEMLFGAFEKHQYYNIKDLQRITQQPMTFLKEILKELCIYNMKAPHRNMWELKPEYRHYKQHD